MGPAQLKAGWMFWTPRPHDGLQMKYFWKLSILNPLLNQNLEEEGAEDPGDRHEDCNERSDLDVGQHSARRQNVCFVLSMNFQVLCETWSEEDKRQRSGWWWRPCSPDVIIMMTKMMRMVMRIITMQIWEKVRTIMINSKKNGKRRGHRTEMTTIMSIVLQLPGLPWWRWRRWPPSPCWSPQTACTWSRSAGWSRRWVKHIDSCEEEEEDDKPEPNDNDDENI